MCGNRYISVMYVGNSGDNWVDQSCVDSDIDPDIGYVDWVEYPLMRGPGIETGAFIPHCF